MSETVVVEPVAVAARKRPSRRVVGVVVLSAALLTVATVWVLHWRSSLHPFRTYPMYGVGAHPSVGQTYYFGEEALVANRSGVMTLHIDSVRPRIAENTADADIAVLRCTFSGYRAFGLAGEQAADAKLVCASLTPFRSGTFRIKPAKGGDDLVIAITPRRPGAVRMAGLDIRYTSGFRYGSQHVGAQVWTTTP